MTLFERQPFNPEQHIRVLKSLLELSDSRMAWTQPQYRQLVGNITVLLKPAKVEFGIEVENFLKKINQYKARTLSPEDPQVRAWLNQVTQIQVANNETLAQSIALLVTILTTITATQSAANGTEEVIENQPTSATRTSTDRSPVVDGYSQYFAFPNQPPIDRILAAGEIITTNFENTPIPAMQKWFFEKAAAVLAQEADGTIETRARELYARGEYEMVLNLIKESQVYQDIWKSGQNTDLSQELRDHYIKDGKHIFTSDKINVQGLHVEDFKALVLFAEVMTGGAYSQLNLSVTFNSGEGVRIPLHRSIADQIQPVREHVRNVMMLIATFPDHISGFTEIQLGLLNAILTNIREDERNRIITAYVTQHEESENNSATDWRETLVDTISRGITSHRLQAIIDQFDNLKIVNTYTEKRPGKYAGQNQLVRVTTAASLSTKDSIGIRWGEGWQGPIIILFARRKDGHVSIVSGSMQTNEPQQSKIQHTIPGNQDSNNPIPQALAQAYTGNLGQAGDPSTLAELLQNLLKEQQAQPDLITKPRQNAGSSEGTQSAQDYNRKSTLGGKSLDSQGAPQDKVLVEEVYYDLGTGQLITGSFEDYRRTIERQLSWLQVRVEQLSTEQSYISSRFPAIATYINSLNEQILELQTSPASVPDSLTSQYTTCLNICILMLAELRTVNTTLLYNEGVEELALAPSKLFATYQKLQALFSYVMVLPGYPAAFTLLYPKLIHDSFTTTIATLETELGLANEQLTQRRVDSTRKIPFDTATSESTPHCITPDQVIEWQDTVNPRMPELQNTGEPQQANGQESQHQNIDPIPHTPLVGGVQTQDNQATPTRGVETTKIPPIIFDLHSLNESAKRYLLAFQDLDTGGSSPDQQTISRLANEIRDGLFPLLIFGTKKPKLTSAQINSYLEEYSSKNTADSGGALQLIDTMRLHATSYFDAILDSSDSRGVTIPALSSIEELLELQKPTDLAVSNLRRSQFITDLTSALATNERILQFYIISQKEPSSPPNTFNPSGIINTEIRQRVSAFVDKLLIVFKDEIKAIKDLQNQNKDRLKNIVEQFTPTFDASLIAKAKRYLSTHQLDIITASDSSIVFQYFAKTILPDQTIPPLENIDVSRYPVYLREWLNTYNILRENLYILISVFDGFNAFASTCTQFVRDSDGGGEYAASMSLRVFNTATESMITSPDFLKMVCILGEYDRQLALFEAALAQFNDRSVLPLVELKIETRAFINNSDQASSSNFSLCLQQIVADRDEIKITQNPQMSEVVGRLRETLSSPYYATKLSTLLYFITSDPSSSDVDAEYIKLASNLISSNPLDGLFVIAVLYYNVNLRNPMTPDQGQEHNQKCKDVLERIVPFLPILSASYSAFGQNFSQMSESHRESILTLSKFKEGTNEHLRYSIILLSLEIPTLIKNNESGLSNNSGFKFDHTLFDPIHTIPAILDEIPSVRTDNSSPKEGMPIDSDFWGTISKTAARNTDALIAAIQARILEIQNLDNQAAVYLGSSSIVTRRNAAQMREYALDADQQINTFKNAVTEHLRQGDIISHAEFTVYATILFLVTSIQHNEAFGYLAINNDLQYIDAPHFKIIAQHYTLLNQMIIYARTLSLQKSRQIEQSQFNNIMSASPLCKYIVGKLPPESSEAFSIGDLEQVIANTLDSANLEEYTLEAPISLKTKLEQGLHNIPEFPSLIEKNLIPHIQKGCDATVRSFIDYYSGSQKTIADTFGILSILFKRLETNTVSTSDKPEIITNLANQAHAIYLLALMVDDQCDISAHQALNGLNSETSCTHFSSDSIISNDKAGSIHALFKRADIPSFLITLGHFFAEQK